jgi:nitrogen fixation/metabolism regulation signal transduction histidine kinase
MRRVLESGMTRFEKRTLFGTLAVAVPGAVGLLFARIAGMVPTYAFGFLAPMVAIATGAFAYWQYRRIMFPLYTLTGLLEALREGDYSLRGGRGGVLEGAIYDVNALAERLQRQRVHFEESSHLLAKTLASLDSAVMVFDGDARLRLLNAAAQRLLREDRDRLFGRSLSELALEGFLQMRSGTIVPHTFPGGSGRFEIRHAPLRSEGREGCLLVVNDLGRLLREEERLAWQRLLRVLGHEVNNSLAPIRSMAETLTAMAGREPLPDDWADDLRSGLDIIGSRARSLARFLSGYSRLTRLPPPQKQWVDLGEMCTKVARLEQRLRVEIVAGPELHVMVDPDQLEQALINLVRNAVEAVHASDNGRGGVRLTWSTIDGRVCVDVEDDGPGLPTTDNLFVPFFTTKPGGSGIGLALVRTIAEAHDGGVALEARPDRRGVRARLWIPGDVPEAGQRYR